MNKNKKVIENENEIEEKTDVNDRKFAQIAEKIISGKIVQDPSIVSLIKYYKDLQMTEDNLGKSIGSYVNNFEIYSKYLKHISGIGPILSANLISMITPIDKFQKPSMLVAYAGLAGQYYDQECENGHKMFSSSPKVKCPIFETDTGEKCDAKIIKSTMMQGIMKRKKGYHIMENTKLKTTLYKIATSFEKQSSEKSQYRALYDAKKAEYNSRTDMTKGHARMMVLRYIEKRFLVNLHVVWMGGIGNKVTPYEATLPNHTIDEIRTDDNTPIPALGSFDTTNSLENWTIHQLTDSYYDIQKIRIKVFNNVVAWVKNNPDKIGMEISQN